ncbi:hypothetical protein SEA_PHAYONCE_57 [Mycobacterium phage Phayonce]|uniref:Uncharacterized protein n=1 Tax=Mycobacterium phage Phayonce TaxID=1647302 RepID=A0A0F6SJL3_9CAUD|nr:hypothetical protein SEA_PHAYONCE_57 [Mycobacterium phage Phayonce]AKF14417.1 hypothetical protein SEA_PHAYONCE_57 [Mycobacterium phage Phayonce]
MNADELVAWRNRRRTHRSAWGHPHPKPLTQQPQPQEKR